MSSADKAQQNIDEAKENAKQNIDQAKQSVEKTKRSFFQKLEDDGVVNPSGLAMVGFSGAFFAAIPVTSWIAQPGGLLEKAVNGVCHSVAYVSSAGASSAVPQSGKIAALGALYIAVTYAISGANSAAGVASGNKEGRDNNYPRTQVANLKGLPLRLHSAHYNLLEMFPGWAIAAALTQAIAPTDQGLVNLLGLHVLSKVFVYYPSYLLNVSPTRSLAHVLATASVINVALTLAKRPLI